MQHLPQAVDGKEGHRRTQSDVGRKVAIVNTHGRHSSSGPTAQQSQVTESTDFVPYSRMHLSQSHKASQCPIVPSELPW